MDENPASVIQVTDAESFVIGWCWLASWRSGKA
jgi:hypothetical protein